MVDSKSSSDKGLAPMDFSNEPKLYRMVVGAVGGQGGGAVSEILFNAVRIERIKHGGEKGKSGNYEKRSMTPGLAQRSGSTVTSLSFIDPSLSEDQLPDSLIISEMPHRSSAHIIIAQEINELMKYIERAKLDAWVIANEVRSITPSEKSPDYIPQTSIEQQIQAAKKYLENGTYVGIDGAKIIMDNSLDPRSLNVVMMGMVSASKKLPISRESYLEAMGLRFKGKVYDINVMAFEVGEKYYLEGRYKERNENYLWQDHSLDEIKHQAQSTATYHRRERAKKKLITQIEPILSEIINIYPENIASYVLEGFGQLVDFQDLKHGIWYLDLVKSVFEIDKSDNHRMTKEFSQNMAGRILQWEGPFRVAEYAIHEKHESPESNQIYHLEKKLQPTLEEVVGMIPVPNFIYRRRPEFLYRWYDKRKFKGKSTNIKTTGFFGYGFFWFLSKFKRIRRTTVRFRREKILVETIMNDISTLHKLSPKLAEELCWYIGKIRGFSFVRHNHIVAYHKIANGVNEILASKGEKVAKAFIQTAYSTISAAGQHGDELDQLIQDHLNDKYMIPLIVQDR